MESADKKELMALIEQALALADQLRLTDVALKLDGARARLEQMEGGSSGVQPSE